MNKRKKTTKTTKRCCTSIGKLLDPKFFKALCDPNRLALLARLAKCNRPCSVSEMNKCCPTDMSVVSRHLAILRDAGIVHAQKKGKEVYYTVCSDDIVETLRSIADSIEKCCC